MTPPTMFIVVAYDISDDHRRQKVAKALERYGERVNFSVFECDLDRSTLKRLLQSLHKLIHPQNDQVRYYELCALCRERLTVQGRRPPCIEGPVRLA